MGHSDAKQCTGSIGQTQSRSYQKVTKGLVQINVCVRHSCVLPSGFVRSSSGYACGCGCGSKCACDSCGLYVHRQIVRHPRQRRPNAVRLPLAQDSIELQMHDEHLHGVRISVLRTNSRMQTVSTWKALRLVFAAQAEC